jgi:hypothetical protein
MSERIYGSLGWRMRRWPSQRLCFGRSNLSLHLRCTSLALCAVAGVHQPHTLKIDDLQENWYAAQEQAIAELQSRGIYFDWRIDVVYEMQLTAVNS